MLQLEFTVVFLQLLATEVPHLYLASHVLGGRLLLGLLADKALKSRWLSGQVFDRVNADSLLQSAHWAREEECAFCQPHDMHSGDVVLEPLYLNHQWKVAII
jgi:hypothetical protein